MRLICYPTSGEPPRIIAAPVERDWMDRTPNWLNSWNFADR